MGHGRGLSGFYFLVNYDAALHPARNECWGKRGPYQLRVWKREIFNSFCYCNWFENHDRVSFPGFTPLCSPLRRRNEKTFQQAKDSDTDTRQTRCSSAMSTWNTLALSGKPKPAFSIICLSFRSIWIIKGLLIRHTKKPELSFKSGRRGKSWGYEQSLVVVSSDQEDTRSEDHRSVQGSYLWHWLTNHYVSHLDRAWIFASFAFEVNFVYVKMTGGFL